MFYFFATLALFAAVFTLRNLPGKACTIADRDFLACLPLHTCPEPIKGKSWNYRDAASKEWYLIKTFGNNGAVIQIGKKRVSTFLKKDQTIADAACEIIREIYYRENKDQFQAHFDARRSIEAHIMTRGLSLGLDYLTLCRAMDSLENGNPSPIFEILECPDCLSLFGQLVIVYKIGNLSAMYDLVRKLDRYETLSYEEKLAYQIAA